MTEITIGWGDDTVCSECAGPLPAGAPAWLDRDLVLCAFCAERVAA